MEKQKMKNSGRTSFIGSGLVLRLNQITTAVVNRFILLSSALLLVACSNGNLDIMNDHPGLIEAVDKYYKFEMNKEWESTYEMRAQDFRNVIDKRHYIETMSANSVGWDLLGYEIVDASINENKQVVLTIDFTYQLSPEVRPDEGKETGKYALKDISVWQKIGGTWFCDSAGIQGHLPLNNAIAR